MVRVIYLAIIVLVAMAMSVQAQVFTDPGEQPERVRGTVIKVDDSAAELKTRDGKTMRLGLADYTSYFKLSKTSFTEVQFGSYVGAVSKKLTVESPIVRDSMSWLHQGFELRILDESLRGLALGHTKWDLTPESVMTHGWVDDAETRVLSIKYGPTEEEETDVNITRDLPILKLSPGDKSLLKPGAHVFAGVHKGEDGKEVAVFIMIGESDVVPAL